jgi:hypothetical protein
MKVNIEMKAVFFNAVNVYKNQGEKAVLDSNDISRSQ